MDIKKIIPLSNGEYAVKEKKDLCDVSRFVSVGAKVLCLEDKKVYIQTDVNEWVSV